MPNPLAFLVLAIFPLVVLAFFKRLPPDRALIWSLLLGYLFLPEPPAHYDFPLAPPLNKHNIPAFVAFAVTLWMHGGKAPLLPEGVFARVLVIVFVFSPILTVLTNGEPVFWGQVGLPALGLKDAVALTMQQALLLLPFLLARQFLASGGAQEHLLRAFVIGGLVYSLLMLIEIRLSPQLNLWIYGYYQHLFGQSVRFGGYRPVVFLYHGLWVAFFTLTAVIAAFGLWRNGAAGKQFKYLLAAAYLTVILVMAKSLGSLILLVLALPLLLFLPLQWQLRAAMVIGMLALAYPLMKGAGVIPEQALLNQVSSINADRAASLDFRFDNETMLLDRAYEKVWFGWGSWGRNHIIDPVSGLLVTVTDGRWIITIGVYGWVGFAAEFSLILLPLFLIAREARLSRGSVSPLAGPLALILALNVADMIPNATLTPLTWLVVGALLGYAERLRAERLGRQRFTSPLAWRPILGALGPTPDVHADKRDTA